MLASITLQKVFDIVNIWSTLGWVAFLAIVVLIVRVCIKDAQKRNRAGWGNHHYDDWLDFVQTVAVRLAITGAILNLFMGIGEAAFFKKESTLEASGYSERWEWRAFFLEMRWGALLGFKISLYTVGLLLGTRLSGPLPRLPDPHEQWLTNAVERHLKPKTVLMVVIGSLCLGALLAGGGYILSAIVQWHSENRLAIRLVSIGVVAAVLVWFCARHPAETADLLKDVFSFSQPEDSSPWRTLGNGAIKVVLILIVIVVVLAATWVAVSWLLDATLGQMMKDWMPKQ